MQLYRLIAILLVLTVTGIDTFAQNRCASLFETNFIKPSQQYENLHTIYSAISENIKFLYLQKEKSTASEAKIVEIHKQFTENYIPQLESYLKSQNIEYKVSYQNDGPEEYLKNLRYPIFTISPSLRSGLNKYALGIFKKVKVSLIYAPFMNLSQNFASAFMPSLNSIALPSNAIIDGQFAEAKISGHEIKHALFQAERNGLYKPKIHSPTHGYVKNTKDFSLVEKKPYQSFFSFEELVTYAYTISAEVKSIQRIKKPAQLADLNKYVEILKDISQRSSELCATAILHIDRLPWSVLDHDNSITVEISKEIKIVLQVPFAEKENYKKDPFSYAKNEFLKIQKLAEFNLQYIQQVNSNNILMLLSALKSNQVHFLEKSEAVK